MLDTQKALNVLIQAVQVANQKGAFSLAESKTIAEAVEAFVTPPKAAEGDKKEDTSEKK